jgi:hypothetical protein
VQDLIRNNHHHNCIVMAFTMAAERQGRRQITHVPSGIGPEIIPLEAGDNVGSFRKKKRLDLGNKRKGTENNTHNNITHTASKLLVLVGLTGVMGFLAQTFLPIVQQEITYQKWIHASASSSPAVMQARQGYPYYLGAVDPDTVQIRNTLTPNQQRQIDQFRNGSGLLLNIHITHHGGTTFCYEIGRRLHAPSFACMSPRLPEDADVGEDFPKRQPWSHNDTSTNIALIRKSFNMISWEFSAPMGASLPQIDETHWEHEQLVSVFVARDPISRLLAGDAMVNRLHPTLFATRNATLDDWWAFARDDMFTNNYCMRIFAGRSCCQGNITSPEFLSKAKSIVKRFTIILDVACLDAGIAALGKILALNMSIPVKNSMAPGTKRSSHEDPKDKIPYPEVYEYLVQKNRLDIEFYEWSKQRSLVNCDEFWKGEKANNLPHQTLALP